MVPLDSIFFTAVTLSALLAAQPFIQLWRLEGYSLRRFFLRIRVEPGMEKWLLRLWLTALLWQAAAVAADGLYQLVSQLLNPTSGPLYLVVSNRVMGSISLLAYALPSVFAAVNLYFFILWARQKQRPPILYPAKVLRLHVGLAVVLVGLQLGIYQLVYQWSAFVYRLVPNVNMELKIVIFYSALIAVFAVTKLLLECFAIVLVPRLIALASFVMWPVEKIIEKKKVK